MQVCSPFTGAGTTSHSGSGGQRRSFPWGRSRATLLRWMARLCCSWPKRTFDTDLLIQVRNSYGSYSWKERRNCKRVWRGTKEDTESCLLGWAGQWSREGTETLKWGKDKKQEGRVVGKFGCNSKPKDTTFLSLKVFAELTESRLLWQHSMTSSSSS